MTIQRQAVFWIVSLASLLLFLWLFRSILLPFVMGMALAYVLDPVADRLERLGLSRLWATIAILALSVLTFVMFFVLVIPLLIGQLESLIERLPDYIARMQELTAKVFKSRLAEIVGLDKAHTPPDEVIKTVTTWLGTLVSSILSGSMAVINFISLFVVTPVVAFYLLYDWDRMVALIDEWLPRGHAETIRELIREINIALAGFIRGQGTVCVILGLFYAVSLSLIGLNFGLLIGLTAGLISFIPYVGTIVGFILSVGVAVFQFWPDWIPIAGVAAVFAVGQVVEGNILQPKLVGSSVGIHPVWLMFALFAFASLFGFVGMLVAVPATAAIGVLVRFGLRQYRASEIYSGTAGNRSPDTGKGSET